MNGIAGFGDELLTGAASFAAHNHCALRRAKGKEAMTSAMMAFGIAVGGAALIGYLLMARPQHRRGVGGSSGDGSGSNGGNYAGDGWSIASWSGGGNSGSHDSGTSNDSDGGGDGGGGGGDGGGGGGDGGGGGGGD
jgi:hypothetical protein